MAYQTVVDNLNVMRGNALLEVAPYVDGEPAWVSAGAISDLEVEIDASVAKEENDNADSTDRFNKQEAKIKFTQIELLRLDVWEILYGALVDIEMESDSTQISGGHKSAIPYFMTRLTTENDSKVFKFTAYKCNLQKLFSLKYAKDDADDTRLKIPVEIVGKTDPYRGDKVWNIEGPFNG
jgi:hypothetical protein